MAIKEFSGQFSTCCLTLINQDDLLNPRLTRTWMLNMLNIIFLVNNFSFLISLAAFSIIVGLGLKAASESTY